MAKAISGKIEWLASHGSLLRLDAISLGLALDQKEPSIILPSQKRVPEGEKIRKQAMRERESKLDKHNRPQGERAERESQEEKLEREIKLDVNSRPNDQKVILQDEES